MGGERTAKRDNGLNLIGANLGQLACVDAAEAPADKADFAPASLGEFPHACDHSLGDAVAQAIVTTLAPTAHLVTVVRKKGSERPRREVACNQARKDRTGRP